MRKYVYIAAILLASLTLIFSCGGPSASTYTNEPNYSFLYNPASTRIHPVVQVYHDQDSSSEMIIKLFPDELLFNKANSMGVMMASVTVSYLLYELTGNNNTLGTIADSSMRKYELQQADVDKRFYITDKINAKRGKNYFLTMKIIDNHRNAMATRFYYVEKKGNVGRQDFKITYQSNNQIAFDPLVINSNEVSIEYSDKSIGKLFVKYYNNYQEVPPPVNLLVVEPSVYGKYDSIFEIEVDGIIHFKAEKEGMYLFQTDTSLEKGLSLIKFYDDFPKIEDQEQLARPLLYLASDVKLREIMGAKNKKMAVDNYWLEVAGDNFERARQLVRVYYNRVFYANYYFTSFKEGWLTDRGMVYIIYGRPDIIHKGPDKEEWIYLGNSMTRLLTFNFYRSDNAFNLDHFVLKRGDGTKTYWQEAMLSWQNGNVFSVDNL